MEGTKCRKPCAWKENVHLAEGAAHGVEISAPHRGRVLSEEGGISNLSSSLLVLECRVVELWSGRGCSVSFTFAARPPTLSSQVM